MRTFDYRTALRAKGLKPIPRPDQLRTVKRPGDWEDRCVGGVQRLVQVES